ncbi:hypothetical protein ACWGI9_11290 [Streptomyces sp. NPDC054833]
MGEQSPHSGADGGVRPGRPIGQWDPHDLEVHPAGVATATSADGARVAVRRELPGYVPREHDRLLAEAAHDAAEGRSRAVILVGASSTGKTRACWEAVRPLADHGWQLWHPFDPTRAQAALEGLHRVGAKTVVWLNEAQHYLGDPRTGEHVAAQLHDLLTRPERGPVLVLGTLWPEYAHQYFEVPNPGEPDPHSRTRELLAGRTITVPDTFSTQALEAAAALAEGGDQLLADALTRARDHGRLAQDLAGAPELLTRYHTATPPARGMLEAAMDARRLGVGLALPQAFLTDAATDYLSDHDYDLLAEDWAEQAYAELARPVHGKQAALRRANPRPPRRPPGSSAPSPESWPVTGTLYRLADYLEQHGRETRRLLCPPASFWQAAHTHLARSDDLANVAAAADARYRMQWAHHLWLKAANTGDARALLALARRRDAAGDTDGAEAAYRQAAEAGSSQALLHLTLQREETGEPGAAEAFARQAADGGDTRPLLHLARKRYAAGHSVAADAAYRQAAEFGDTRALRDLARIREAAGDGDGAESLARQAAEFGDTRSLRDLAWIREAGGDRMKAEALAQLALDASDCQVLLSLARRREESGELNGAEAAYRQAAAAGDTEALCALTRIREKAGDRGEADRLARQAADAGNTRALVYLTRKRSEAGDEDGAEETCRIAAAAGDSHALAYLAQVRAKKGRLADAEFLAEQAADLGDTQALLDLARLRDAAGDLDGAETAYRRAFEAGESDALVFLAQMWGKARRWPDAEVVARQAAERGDNRAFVSVIQLRMEAGEDQGAELLAQQIGEPFALLNLAWMRQDVGDMEGAERLARCAADTGHAEALATLAYIRERRGDREGAEAFAVRAAEAGDLRGLLDVARMREAAGDKEGAERFARLAADAGDPRALFALATSRMQSRPYDDFDIAYHRVLDEAGREPIVRPGGKAFMGKGPWWYGLEPDGTLSPPW